MTDSAPRHPLGEAIAQGLNAHADHMRTEHQQFRKEERKDLLETLEREGIEAIQQILGDRINCGDLPPDVAQLVDRICKPTHQAEVGAVAGLLIAIGYILGSAVLTGPTSQVALASMKASGTAPLDPVGLAGAVHTGRVPLDRATDLLAESGIKLDKVQTLLDMTMQGMPMGSILELLRRRVIDDGLYNDLATHTGLDSQGIELSKLLRVGPPSEGMATNMVTQNIIDMATYAELLEQNGIAGNWAQQIFESAGATMPPEMAVRLFREHRIDLATFEQVLLESNLKNKYVPMMKWLQFRPPPMEQTLRMRRYGLIDHAEAVDILEQNGFETKYAELLTTAAETQAEGGGKDLTTATMIDLYEVGKWDRGTLVAELVKAGYDPTESDLLATLADERRVIAQQNRAAAKIRSRYVMWKIDRSEALNALNQVGIPPDQVAEALDVWDVERDAQTLHLTRVDIKKAVQANVISEADGRARLLGMGYDAADVNVIVQIDKW